MKNVRLLAPLCLMTCLTLAAALPQDMLRPQQMYTVPKDNQPLFNEPVRYLGIKARLSKGQQLGIKARKGQWRQVEGEGREGWVQVVAKRHLGGVAVSEEYLTSATTAPIGAGLVTKGFGEAYGQSNGQEAEDASQVNTALDGERFDIGEYDAFLAGGDLAFSPLEPLAAASDPAPGDGASVPADSGGSERQPEVAPVDEPEPAAGGGSESLLDSLKRGKQGKHESLQMAQDPLFFVHNLSYEAEREMGLAVGQRLAAGRIFEDEALTRYVSLIGAAVVEQCDRADIPYRFVVLADDEINAFAAPAGFIFITTGCIRACRSEAELAGVIAHEVAHVARRHALRTMDMHKSQITKAMSAARMDESIEKYMGGMDPETAALVRELRGVADENYKYCTQGWGQEFELEADAYGLRYAAAVGWDYRGLFRFLATLGEGESTSLGTAYRSHPPASERIEKLKRVVRSDRLEQSGNFLEERFKANSAGVR